MKQNEFEELQINTALQAAITPVGLEFNRNDFMLGEYFCRVYTVISYPSNPEYGWYSKLTNLPGTIVAINYEPIDNGLLLSNMVKNITTQRGIQLSTKTRFPVERFHFPPLSAVFHLLRPALTTAAATISERTAAAV